MVLTKRGTNDTMLTWDLRTFNVTN